MGRAVISTIGRDKPGIVSSLTSIVHDLDLNVEDSRMTVLGSEFAVLMSVSGAEPALSALEAQLTAFCSSADMAFLFRRTEQRIPSENLPYRVRVVAMDHPGIVRNITEFFSRRQINIRDLATETAHAPHTGTLIFNLSMAVEIPAGVKITRLRDDFTAFCEVQDLDGELFAE